MTDRNENSIKRHLMTLVRVCIGFGLAGWLLHSTLAASGSDLCSDLQGADVPMLVCALGIYGGILCITVIRWRLLLAVQGIRLGFWAVARLTMIGVFFNILVPGAVGGDLLKMAYITGRAPDKKAEAVFTIMVDRVLGLLGLLIVAALMILFCLPVLLELGAEHRFARIAVVSIGLGSLAGILGIAAIEMRQTVARHPSIARIVQYGAAKLPRKIVRILTRLVKALELYREERPAVAIATLLSVSVHSLLGVDLYIIGRALGERALGLKDYFLTTQIGNAVAGIPLTPGGLGTRDKTVSAFLEILSGDPGKIGSIPITLSIIIVFWGLVGALVFVFTPGRD